LCNSLINVSKEGEQPFKKSLKTRRILFVGNTMSSMANFRGSLLLRLEKDYEVFVLAPFDGGEQFFINSTIHCIDLKLARKSLNPFKDLALFLTFRRIYKQLEPSVVFNYTIKPCIWGSLASGFLNIKNIAVITGLGYAFSQEGFLKKIVQSLYKFALHKTSRVCFLNEGDQGLFIEKRLIKKQQSFLLSGEGVDCHFFQGQKIASASDQVTNKFLLIGRILYDKGVAVYAQAAMQILKNFADSSRSNTKAAKPEFYLLGPYDPQNPSHILPEAILQWPITYLGNTADVRPYIEEADCVVLPSFSEGLPRVLLEAMAMEKPVIASRLSGTERLIKAPENGFFCEARDVGSLTQAMADFLNLKRADRLKIGQTNRLKVLSSFSDEVVYQEYLSILKSI
jgi:glycosyltransferase involved in cell wall biosynthesis